MPKSRKNIFFLVNTILFVCFLGTSSIASSEIPPTIEEIERAKVAKMAWDGLIIDTDTAKRFREQDERAISNYHDRRMHDLNDLLIQPNVEKIRPRTFATASGRWTKLEDKFMRRSWEQNKFNLSLTDLELSRIKDIKLTHITGKEMLTPGQVWIKENWDLMSTEHQFHGYPGSVMTALRACYDGSPIEDVMRDLSTALKEEEDRLVTGECIVGIAWDAIEERIKAKDASIKK